MSETKNEESGASEAGANLTALLCSEVKPKFGLDEIVYVYKSPNHLIDEVDSCVMEMRVEMIKIDVEYSVFKSSPFRVKIRYSVTGVDFLDDFDIDEDHIADSQEAANEHARRELRKLLEARDKRKDRLQRLLDATA